MPQVVLHQFLYSHFNDKVRWALSFKAVDYEPRSYLPGPHALAIKKISDQTQTPVLEWDGRYVSGSAAIIDFLEQKLPQNPLLPIDAKTRENVRRWQDRYDTEVGPATRTVLFSILLEEPDYLCEMFSEGRPALQRWLYRRTFPLAKAMISRANAVDNEASIKAAFAVTETALDEIAATTAASGYLVGDRFTAADLCAAALIAPLNDPPCVDMQRPTPLPARVRQFTERWRAHPACAWMHRMYREHRQP